MAQVDVSVKVEQAAYDLGQQLVKLVVAVKAAGGFKIEAIPAEIAALVAGLPALVDDISKVSAEVAESKALVGKSLVMSGFDLAASL